MLEAASLFTLVWVCSFSLYALSVIKPTGLEWLGNVPTVIHPFLLLLITAISMIIFQVRSNFWLLRTIARILAAPFVTPVLFRDFYVADQLISLSIVLCDLEFAICYFSSDAWTLGTVCHENNYWIRPIISALPGIWRLLQCFRRFKDSKDKAHLLNAAKVNFSRFSLNFL